jgi:hypothetical protein
MRIYRGLAVGYVLVLLGLSACQARAPSVVTPGPLPTESVAALFQDDFSDPGSGWRQLDAAGGRAAYADGVYQMRVDGANYNVMSTSGKRYSDARLEVDAIKTPGERNNRFGLICRLEDAANLYVFLISSDGYYGIGKIVQGKPQLIGMDAMLPGDKIPQGSGVSHLRADCDGSRLALYVNGEKIVEVQDTDLNAGEVGLIAGSYSPQGTEILFDNFKVYAP